MRIIKTCQHGKSKEKGGGVMTFKEVERRLLDDGWQFKNAKGSHRFYKHPTKKGKVTVPYHSGDLDIRTVKSIFKQAGLL